MLRVVQASVELRVVLRAGLTLRFGLLGGQTRALFRCLLLLILRRILQSGVLGRRKLSWLHLKVQRVMALRLLLDITVLITKISSHREVGRHELRLHVLVAESGRGPC